MMDMSVKNVNLLSSGIKLQGLAQIAQMATFITSLYLDVSLAQPVHHYKLMEFANPAQITHTSATNTEYA